MHLAAFVTTAMDYRIQLKRREQQETLQSHWLAPVSINNRGPFLFAVEPSRYRTLVTARIVEDLGVAVDELPNALANSDNLAYPLLRLQSFAVGSAILNDFEIVVWGWPAISVQTLAEMEPDTLYPLGNDPLTPITSIMECRGVLGSDFLRHFKVCFDFSTETLVLQR
jgi:hypothetical protein